MGVTSEAADIQYTEHTRWGRYVPPERVVCKMKNCDRGVYADEICKIHSDMAYYAKITKELRRKR